MNNTLLEGWNPTVVFVLDKEFIMGNRVSSSPLCKRYGAAAILTVTYGGELLYLRIWGNHSTRSAHVSVAACFTMRQPISVRDVKFGGLSYEKLRRHNNSPPYEMTRWPPQQIPPLNFPGLRIRLLVNSCLFKQYKKILMVWDCNH